MTFEYRIILRYECDNGCSPWERTVRVGKDLQSSHCPNCNQFGLIVGRRPA